MFKINRDASNWQANLLKSKDGPFKTQMDLYYLYFMTGIGLNLDTNFPNMSSQMSDLTSSYPSAFSASIRYKIAGLFLYRDMLNNNLPIDNKEIIKKQIESKLSKEDGNTFLTPEAVNQMNIYAFNGFEYLKNKYTSAPSNEYIFLTIFYNDVMPHLFKGS